MKVKVYKGILPKIIMKTTIKVESGTRDRLIQARYEYGFSSMDALIQALLKNSKLLKSLLKNEQSN